MNNILYRIIIGMCLFVGVPASIALVVMAGILYLSALDWAWMGLQAWWMA